MKNRLSICPCSGLLLRQLFLRRITMLHKSFTKRSRVSRAHLLRLFSTLAILSLIVLPAGAFAAPQEAPSNDALASKMIFFASDGMRPDMVDKYAGEGIMPTFAEL